jgi:hypothetical protein
MCTYFDRKSAKSFRGRNQQFVYKSVAEKGVLIYSGSLVKVVCYEVFYCVSGILNYA